MNLQDITTQNDLEEKNAVFSFDIYPRLNPSISLDYRVQIQWSELRKEFGGYTGSRTYDQYVSITSERSCSGTPNHSFELVKPGSYKLTVATAALGNGPLSINASVSLACSRVTSRFCTYCSQYRYTSQISSNIDISAKRGTYDHTLQHAIHIVACMLTLYS